jgi:hypothetical protein
MSGLARVFIRAGNLGQILTFTLDCGTIKFLSALLLLFCQYVLNMSKSVNA